MPHLQKPPVIWFVMPPIQIRNAQLDEGFNDAGYDSIEKEFFSLYHADKARFRKKLHSYVLARLDD